jgi:hypothetical protein
MSLSSIMTYSSSSAAAGDVSHIMHCWARAAVSISARMDGGLVFAGK